MAKSKSLLEAAAAKILERRNKTEAQWKKEVLEKTQFDFFRGKDKDLEEYVVKREREKMVFKEMTK